ncbi:MAG TPA: DUF1697 domain-containing protein [Anaerolineales bacterium]|nr:DUF1697 domain-containing protein [Anaerolineales bacterium]
MLEVQTEAKYDQICCSLPGTVRQDGVRGIAPANPNMRNDKLRGVFEKLGFANVKTVISSGNVIFESPSRSAATLEETIEKALPEHLGFTSTTILRSQVQIKRLVDQNPFKGMEHSQTSSLNVTFLKKKRKVDLKFPYNVNNRDDSLLGMYNGAICSVIDLTSAKTPDLMVWLEKQFGKEITTRTWKTVGRILKAME